jgi:hypothetical protein
MVQKVLDFFHDFFEILLKVLYGFEIQMNLFDFNLNILFVHLGKRWKFDLQMTDCAGIKSVWSGKKVFFVDF